MLMKLARSVAALALLGSCATAEPAPLERLARSQAAVRAAEEGGAAQEPRAAYHLKLAREQLADARRLLNAGQNAAAVALLRRAAADADLALAYTRLVLARREAATVKKEVLSLRNSR